MHITKMKKVAATLLATAALSTGLTAVTATPAAATHDCVDRYEYRVSSIGDRKNYVENLYDTRGWVRWSSGDILMKRYYACAPASYVQVKYRWNGYFYQMVNAWRW